MKRISPKTINFNVQPAFLVATVLGLVLIPIKWVLAWLVAVFAHELGHFGALKIYRIDVYSISVKLSGTYMQAAPMTALQETVVAAMGPAASGFLVLALSAWLPCTAVCAFFQLLFNIMPINGFDGERILRNCLQAVLPRRYINPTVICVQAVTFVAVLTMVLYLHWWSLAVIITAALLVRRIAVTFPCKGRKQIVQ